MNYLQITLIISNGSYLKYRWKCPWIVNKLDLRKLMIGEADKCKINFYSLL